MTNLLFLPKEKKRILGGEGVGMGLAEGTGGGSKRAGAPVPVSFLSALVARTMGCAELHS